MVAVRHGTVGSERSAYYGATLAALAVATAPKQFRSSPDIQAQLNSLRDYLNTRYATQSVLNHAALLLASTKIPDLVEADRQKAIVQELLAGQRRWRLEAFFSILALGLEFALDREKASTL